jgi:hypothetical protein
LRISNAARPRHVSSRIRPTTRAKGSWDQIKKGHERELTLPTPVPERPEQPLQLADDHALGVISAGSSTADPPLGTMSALWGTRGFTQCRYA